VWRDQEGGVRGLSDRVGRAVFWPPYAASGLICPGFDHALTPGDIGCRRLPETALSVITATRSGASGPNAEPGGTPLLSLSSRAGVLNSFREQLGKTPAAFHRDRQIIGTGLTVSVRYAAQRTERVWFGLIAMIAVPFAQVMQRFAHSAASGVAAPKTRIPRFLMSGYESQIGPNAGIPRRSKPWTTRQVTVLLLMQTTASALESRYAA
jgi:hypothetical protein